MFGNLDTGDEAHKYITIEKAAKDYPISKLCTLFKVSRSGYYAFLKRRGADRDRDAKALVKKVYEQYNGVYGYRQIQLFLQHDHGVWMNLKRYSDSCRSWESAHKFAGNIAATMLPLRKVVWRKIC
ncbi:IS3 family transposase [Paenibacillus sp. 1-18]|uniref:IS3 family transposase n=1 Tax=Paenibacillus sp. 1-18 TaxID=1333846 RepID=UPI0012DF2A6C